MFLLHVGIVPSITKRHLAPAACRVGTGLSCSIFKEEVCVRVGVLRVTRVAYARECLDVILREAYKRSFCFGGFINDSREGGGDLFDRRFVAIPIVVICLGLPRLLQVDIARRCFCIAHLPTQYQYKDAQLYRRHLPAA